MKIACFHCQIKLYIVTAAHNDEYFFKDGPFLASFSLFCSSLYLIVQLVDKILPMTGFEPPTSGVGSDHSTN